MEKCCGNVQRSQEIIHRNTSSQYPTSMFSLSRRSRKFSAQQPWLVD